VTIYWAFNQYPDEYQLENAVNKIIENQSALSSIFSNNKQIKIKTKVKLKIIENSNCLNSALEALTRTPFNLTIPPLLRIALIKQKKEKYYFVLTVHHLIFDGWSLNILCKNINEFLSGKPLTQPKLNYFNYADQQNPWYSLSNKAALEYWHEQTFPKNLNFPAEACKNNKPTAPSIYQTLNSEKLKSLNKFASNNQISLFTLLITSYALLLHEYSSNNNILIGTTYFNRDEQNTQDTIGYFVNIIPLIFNIDLNGKLQDILQKIQLTSHLSFKHSLPFSLLKNEKGIEETTPSISWFKCF